MLILPHFGLGDAIILNGMVRHFAETEPLVVFPCLKPFEASVKWMFSDLPNVKVIVFNTYLEAEITCLRWKWPLLRLGHYAPKEGDCARGQFDFAFYCQAGLDFDIRWTKFKVPPAPQRQLTQAEQEHGPYVFLHEDQARRMWINRDLIHQLSRGVEFLVSPDTFQEPNIFALRDIIMGAAQIHVIDSCFLCWIDQDEELARGKSLHWHVYAKPNSFFNWQLRPGITKGWNCITERPAGCIEPMWGGIDTELEAIESLNHG